MGWEKVACWSTKVAISLKRVKIEEKLLWCLVSSALLYSCSPLSVNQYYADHIGCMLIW